MQFWPPVSAISLAIGPSRWASARLMAIPVSVPPVKATPSMRGSRVSAAPTVSPRPGRRCSTSTGTPAACRWRTARVAMSGVCSAGFATTALPAASAPAIWPVKMASGKFHGEMQAKTPRPCKLSSLRSPVGPLSSRGAAKLRRAAAAA